MDVAQPRGILTAQYISTCLLTLFYKRPHSARRGSKHYTYINPFNLPNNAISKVGDIIFPHLMDWEAVAPR